MKKTIISGLVGLLVLGASVSAQAAVITTYATRGAFDAAVGVTSLEDLNGQTPGTSFIGTPLDLGDFTVLRTSDISSGWLGAIEAGSGGFNIDGTTYGRVDTGSFIGDLIFTFDTGITAFGLDLDAWNDGQIRTLVEADGTSVPVTTQADQGSRFFGFSSDTAFTTIRFIGGAGDSFGFDNISYNGSGGGSVPEPATLGFLGLGLLGLGTARRRRLTK